MWRKGQEFNEQNWRRFTHNEVYVKVTDPVTGKVTAKGYVDSVEPGKWTVSRKNRQYADLADPARLRKDIDELRTKYPPTAIVQDTPANRRMLGEDNPMLGQEVGGTMLLEIPPQKGPLNLDALKHADAEDIVIADPTGRIYTREHPEGRHFTKAEMIETFGKELSPP